MKAVTMEQRVVGLNGDEVVAFAAKQANVEVVSAYPITPQTIVVEKFSEYVANGEVDAEFVCVESEHSALSACVGASLAGARVFTATSSQGLALMHEALYLASGLRCPIVMAVANRALSAPINIHNDHSDMMGSRDCGWIQLYAENAQEAYDWTLQAFKIAETPNILLPVAVNFDGFTISHAVEGVRVLGDETVRDFLPARCSEYKLDASKPITIGALALPDYYFEFKRQQEEAMRNSVDVIKRVNEDYARISGRRYSALAPYQMEDAEIAILCMGSVAGTARAVVKNLRKQGKPVGTIKLWSYRPFPVDEVASLVKRLKCLVVLDRTCSFGAPYGPLCSDVSAALYQRGGHAKLLNVISGLGGRDISPRDIEAMFDKALSIAAGLTPPEPVEYLGVRD
jgi:pyruvate ferredoxin oxidoreductase alpha subunit